MPWAKVKDRFREVKTFISGRFKKRVDREPKSAWARAIRKTKLADLKNPLANLVERSMGITRRSNAVTPIMPFKKEDEPKVEARVEANVSLFSAVPFGRRKGYRLEEEDMQPMKAGRPRKHPLDPLGME